MSVGMLRSNQKGIGLVYAFEDVTQMRQAKDQSLSVRMLNGSNWTGIGLLMRMLIGSNFICIGSVHVSYNALWVMDRQPLIICLPPLTHDPMFTVRRRGGIIILALNVRTFICIETCFTHTCSFLLLGHFSFLLKLFQYFFMLRSIFFVLTAFKADLVLSNTYYSLKRVCFSVFFSM